MSARKDVPGDELTPEENTAEAADSAQPADKDEKGDAAAEKGKAPLSIKLNMLWNSIGSYINLFAQWAITVFIVRLTSGYDAAGVYGLAMAVWNIFMPLAHYKMYIYQVSDVDGENTAGEYLSFRVLTCSISLALVVVYSALTCKPEAFWPIVLYALWKIASLVIDVLHGVMQKAGRMDYMGKSYAMQGVTSLLAFITVFGLTQNLVLALILMFFVTVLVGVIYVLPRAKYFDVIKPGISMPKAWHLLVLCAPVVIGSVAAAAAPSLPRQYLINAMGESALGAYSTMAAPVAVIQMGASYIYNPLLTYFSEYYAKGDRKAFSGLMVKTLLGIAAFGAVAAIALELVGRPLLALVYGKSVLQYFYLLQPLMLCAVVTGVMWFVNDLCVALRDFKTTFWGSILAFVLAVAIMVPCVHVFELNGVTVTNIATCVLSAAFMFWRLRKLVHKHFDGEGPQEAAAE